MSNHKIYSFGVPIEGYHVDWTGDEVSPSLTASAIAVWPASSKISDFTSTAMTSSSSITPEDETVWSLRDGIESLIHKKKPVGIYSTTQLAGEYRDKSRRHIFKLELTNERTEQVKANPQAVTYLVREVVSKLEILRDETGADVYVHSLGLDTSVKKGIRNLTVEVYLLGDITDTSRDVYLDPITGEVKFHSH